MTSIKESKELAIQRLTNNATWRREQGNRSATPGDVYLFPLPQDCYEAVEWVVVRVHPDDPDTLFIVPSDSNPLIGTCDVVAARHADEHHEPRTLRCGYGLWISRKACSPDRRVDFVEDTAVRKARKVLHDMISGTLPLTAETEYDPEYEVLCDTLSRALEHVRERS